MDHHIVNQFGIDQTHFDNALKNIQLGIPHDNTSSAVHQFKKYQSKMLLKH